jgi:hypothetical protein
MQWTHYWPLRRFLMCLLLALERYTCVCEVWRRGEMNCLITVLSVRRTTFCVMREVMINHRNIATLLSSEALLTHAHPVKFCLFGNFHVVILRCDVTRGSKSVGPRARNVVAHCTAIRRRSIANLSTQPVTEQLWCSAVALHPVGNQRGLLSLSPVLHPLVGHLILWSHCHWWCFLWKLMTIKQVLQTNCIAQSLEALIFFKYFHEPFAYFTVTIFIICVACSGRS